MKADTEGVLAMGVGAAMKGTIAGFISGVAPQVGISPDILTAVIGYFGREKTSGMWRDFLTGVMIASIGQILRPMVAGIVPALGVGQVGAQPQVGAPAPQTAADYAARL